MAESPYNGPLGIIGKQPWTWTGNPPATPQNNLAESDAMKDRSFINSITSCNQFQNQIAAGVRNRTHLHDGPQVRRTGPHRNLV